MARESEGELMGRKGTAKPSEVIQRLVDIGTSALVEQLDVPQPQAHAAMREVAHLFAREYGGSEVYVSKDQEFALTKRDLVIYERMERGCSTLDVAREYGITPRQVQTITRHVRQQGGARLRQQSLPGLDEE